MTRGRWRRRLAAVAVAALAAAAGCGIPTQSTPRAIPRDQVPFHLLGPPSPAPTTTTAPAVAVPETVFLVGPDQHVIGVRRDVAVPATLTAVLGALLEGPTAAEQSVGIQSFLTGRPNSAVVTVAAGVATVDFATNPVQVVGPDQTLAVAQVVYTVTEQPGVVGVQFQIAGQPTQVPNAAGVQSSGPVTRADYLPQAPT